MEVEKLKKFTVVICGGGSTYTLPMVKTLCDFYEEFPLKKIKFYDIDEGKQSKIFKASKILLEERIPEIVVEESYDKETAFLESDFVLMQIRSGGLEMREKDEKIPLKYNCVGQETCGVGGFAYGMRSVPAVLDIFKAVRNQSTDAWIINYSNPAAIVAEATKRIFPDDKRIINLCDMPIAIMDGFSEALGIKRQDLRAKYFGLNHFGWFTNLYNKDGEDLLPIIREKLRQGAMMPEELKGDSGWVHTFEQLKTMVNDFDEYIPNTYMQYYLYPDKIVEESDKNYTRANSVMDHRLKQVEACCETIIKNKSIKGSGLEKGVHGTYIIELATSIIKNEHREFLIIVKNNGVIPNISQEAMVEVPCIVTSNGIEPLHFGEVDTFYKGLIENQYAYEKLTVDAVMNHDYNAALKALVLNRTVVNTDVAKLILEELMEANKEYWRLDK